MNDPDFTQRLARLEARYDGFERDVGVKLGKIEAGLDMLLKRSYEQQGAMKLSRALIALAVALSALIGAIAGWAGHVFSVH